jgi:uncharacterized membrane protein
VSVAGSPLWQNEDVLGVVLALAAFSWLALLLTAPFLPAPLAGSLYAFCSLICHQRPERSFHLAAIQLPVCARCLGIYAGGAVGVLAWVSYAAAWRRSMWRLRDRPLLIDPRLVLSVGVLPTIVTVALEWGGAWATSNGARAMAGEMLGVAIGLSLGHAVGRPALAGGSNEVPARSGRAETRDTLRG